VSKERARRREEREAARAVAEAKRARLELRRARRRALWKRVRPRRRRVAWGLGRRSSGQRAAVAGVGIAALLLIWYFVESWSARIALSLLVLLALPVLAVVTFDRKGMKL
jgi:Flp pilus assembly protein TadB